MSVIEQKKEQYAQLEQKLSVLRRYNSEIVVSYTTKLTLEEQIRYANKGLFVLWSDIYGKSRIYKYDYKYDS